MSRTICEVCRKIILEALLVFFLAIIVLTPALALTQTHTIHSMHDTYVNASSPDTNYDASRLIVGNVSDSTIETWFLFNMNDPSGYYVLDAVLWTYAYSVNSNAAYSVHPASGTSWTETDLTWNTKPSYDSQIASNQIGSTGWWNWSLTETYSNSFTSGASSTAYVIETSDPSANAYFEDKENTQSTGNVPYINVTMMIPEVYLLSPADSLSTYSTTVSFQYNTTDAGNITNCSLIFDGTVNRTNTSVAENTTSSFSLVNIFPGSHNWEIRCYDFHRYVYEMNPETRDLTILASVEWYNPSSATILDLGSALKNAATITGSRQIYANNSQTDVQVSCTSGDCSRVTTNWTARSMASAETGTVGFSCPTTSAGSFTANFALSSDQDSGADTLQANCTILAPDLRINSTNITFSDDTPTENEIVTITAGIYNLGTYTATDAVVRFYEGNYLTGTQIGSDHTITLNPGQSTTVEQNWTSKIGDYDIYVTVDPPVETNGSIAEINESNNYAYNTIEIQMWTIFVGNVTGYLALGTVDNRTLLKWNVNDVTHSNIYITDTDSNPSFSNLVALSRNTSGAYISNDFLDIDGIMNTTDYPDSINRTYTAGGNPLRTTAFTIFGKAVADVPIVNSTNSSTFVTGMLWDSTDDSNNNHQFDNVSQEDMVFVTVVNQSHQGKYGTYDYEIRIPARLSKYGGPDTQTVTLYTEIK